jgi:hypothetical protein
MTNGSDDESSEAFPSSSTDDVTIQTSVQYSPASYRLQHTFFGVL